MKNKEYDRDRVNERLMAEIRQSHNLIDEARKALNQDNRFTNLTLVGGIKAVIRELHEKEEKVRKLEKELDRMVKKSK